jgi:hypothetical protein
MRLSNLLIAGSNALYVIAAPTDFELNSPLALPVPGSSTYDADLAAAVAYARSHVSSSVQTSTIEPVKQRLCGWYIPKPKGRDKPMYKTGLLLCMETEPGDEMTRMINRYCGFCAVFDGTCFLSLSYKD